MIDIYYPEVLGSHYAGANGTLRSHFGNADRARTDVVFGVWDDAREPA